jgi:hypothetical protein
LVELWPKSTRENHKLKSEVQLGDEKQLEPVVEIEDDDQVGNEVQLEDCEQLEPELHLENVELSESFQEKWDMKYLLSWLHRLTPCEKFHLLKFQQELNPNHCEILDNYLSVITCVQDDDESVLIEDEDEDEDDEEEYEERQVSAPPIGFLAVTKRQQ